MINANAMRHPRVEWEILAACWRAIEYGAAIAKNAQGGEILTVIHDRSAVPALSFYRNCEDVTAKVLPILRAQP